MGKIAGGLAKSGGKRRARRAMRKSAKGSLTGQSKRRMRNEKRASRIEKRKGLQKGEGMKVLANRKQRRKELFKAPPKGQEGFTKKYKGKTVQEAQGKMRGTAMKAAADRLKSQVGDNTDRLLNGGIMPEQPKSGGGFSTGFGGPDRSDILSNAFSAFKRKKGY